MKPVYVIGHKNPDVDCVAAAIAYRTYKELNNQGLYIAAAAGELNDELRYVLDYLNFAEPLVVKSVGTTVEDLLEEKETVNINGDMRLLELSNLMRREKLKTVPVLDENQRFLGLLTIGDMAMIFMDNLGDGQEIEKSPERLRRILETKVASIMKTRDLMLFEKDEALEEVRKQMLATRFRNYPVVDGQNHFLGLISRYNLLDMKRKKVILVDHNEKKQAVDGIEEAEILEIVDHHRVGDLQTISPIYFHNEPVGSTSTLVAELYLNNRLAMSRQLAGLLLSGLLTDTMLFKSPTTTAKDQRIAATLQELSGLAALDWGKKIFEFSSRIDQQSDEELICQDLKEYLSGSTIFAVSQVETVDLASFTRRKANIVKTMQEICQRQAYAFMCLMATDILEEGTELLVAGEKSFLAEQAFGQNIINNSIFLQGVMSRKKQVIPVIYEVLRKEHMI
ncbi:MAG: putative manganese-dependent inorganic diphosphatase [Syntrophomonadaceae bacterium]|nr:putative manganese-dependent inorganic diphosphatase [Syntrophomonadaceae bacterium]